jgi:hypothetical protein
MNNLFGYDVNNTIKCCHEIKSGNKEQIDEEEGNNE